MCEDSQECTSIQLIRQLIPEPAFPLNAGASRIRVGIIFPISPTRIFDGRYPQIPSPSPYPLPPIGRRKLMFLRFGEEILAFDHPGGRAHPTFYSIHPHLSPIPLNRERELSAKAFRCISLCN